MVVNHTQTTGSGVCIYIEAEPGQSRVPLLLCRALSEVLSNLVNLQCRFKCYFSTFTAFLSSVFPYSFSALTSLTHTVKSFAAVFSSSVGGYVGAIRILLS